MRQGFDSMFVTNNRGEIIAIATGADFCAEHECGSKPLMDALTASRETDAEAEFCKAWREGKQASYPDLISRKRIVRNLDRIQVVEVAGAVPELYVGYEAFGRDITAYANEMRFLKVGADALSGVSGAWDEESFGFRVSGEKNVRLLRKFAEQLKAGHAVFAGTFFKGSDKQRLAGVIIALEPLFRPEHRAEIKKAQLEYESNLRLKAMSRVNELNKLSNELGVRHPGHFWPVWSDGGEAQVLYALNPGYGVKAPYYGPYTFDAVAEWMRSGYSHDLKPVLRG
jgi:hypothetical protein